ncbi:MAG: hypothetical protein HPY62_00915 [Bacteroidales bacterium]|nr:hypothetical protein [Bacteroidales bacterium]
MKPSLGKSGFGYIEAEGIRFDHDIIIRLSGDIEKRKKKLSKSVYGTSHIVSSGEAKYIYEKGAEKIVIGNGHSGMLKLSEEAEEYFSKKKLKVVIAPTSEAIEKWNRTSGRVIALFHVTC